MDLTEQVEGPSKELKKQRTKLLEKSLKDKIKTLDELTAPIIILHQKAIKSGNLCAVHSVSPSKLFIAFGGFKNMLPLVEKIYKSNIVD
jgi:hypothetical protein